MILSIHAYFTVVNNVDGCVASSKLEVELLLLNRAREHTSSSSGNWLTPNFLAMIYYLDDDTLTRLLVGKCLPENIINTKLQYN